jgi:hypothetical protein
VQPKRVGAGATSVAVLGDALGVGLDGPKPSPMRAARSIACAPNPETMIFGGVSGRS